MTPSVRIREIFVYGSLMQGGLYWEFMDRGDVKCLGPARCRGTLYDLGEYPGLSLDGKRWIAGELYRPASMDLLLPVLDELETSHDFRREVVEVDWPHGPTPAWCWVYAGATAPGDEIKGGSWRAHLRRRKARG